ncbi:MAG: DNA repair protein RecO [Lachnospiraceae bacterium]|nr:DNA repair protein RecO [Lachnospiraceae bacterium]
MYGKVTVTGMIISSVPMGEFDRRVTILTKEKGKISAFAKGARRPTGNLTGCSQMFSFGQFVLYEGKDSYNLESADVSTSFVDVREDLNAIYYGMYFCEFALHLTRENVKAKEELNLLYVTMRALEKGQMDKKLIRVAFELRFLTEGGEMPESHRCLKCGKEMKEEEHALFNAKEGGLICMDCSGGRTGVPVCRSTVYALQFIVSSPLQSLYSFNVQENVLKELEAVRQTYSKTYAGTSFKSEEMLDILQ